MSLIISYSGVRGIYGKGLTPAVAFRFAQAYGSFRGGNPTFVARDTRPSGRILVEEVKRGLTSMGSSVIDLGVCPTPTIQMAVRESENCGGIMVTASHNPVEPEEWNGFKPFSETGLILDSFQLQLLKHAFAQGNLEAAAVPGTISNDDAAIQRHVTRVLDNVEADLIREAGFKVAIDPGNGAGIASSHALLECLGCQVFAINEEADGKFRRSPEPLAENLGPLAKLVRKGETDIGFAMDADADRLVLASEEGDIISEEYTLALAAASLFQLHTPTPSHLSLVTNMSTSRMMDDIANRFGAIVHRAPTGEIKVVRKMQDTQSMIGGEGNGGIIFPPVVFGRDALSGMALVLWYMAATQTKLSSLIGSFPKYHMIKEKLEVASKDAVDAIIARIIEHYQEEAQDLTDGVKILFEDGSWLLVRPSNTEPIIRLFSEAKTHSQAQQIVDDLKREVLSNQIF